MNLDLMTERLLLKPLDQTDVDTAVEMFTDPAVIKYMGNQLMSEDEICKEMAIWMKRGGNGCIGIWSISDLETAEKYGSGYLLPMPIDEDDTDWDLVVPGVMPDCDVEVGYALKRSAWGNGFATEVCRRLLRFAFEETPLQEIVATIDDGNEKSINVLRKSGLSYQGRRKAYGEDSPGFRINRSEWINLTKGENC